MAKAICSITDCETYILARGWCRSHYSRWRRTGNPLPAAVLRDHEDGTRTCTGCDQRLPLTGFHVDSRARGGRHSRCKTCRVTSTARWYADNPEVQRARMKQRRVDQPDLVVSWERAKYERHRQACIDRSKVSVQQRRARLRGVERDPRVKVDTLRQLHGDECCYCSVTMVFVTAARGQYVPQRATVEHVIPLASGGAHTLANTRLACWQCNLRKNRRTPEQWDVVRANRT